MDIDISLSPGKMEEEEAEQEELFFFVIPPTLPPCNVFANILLEALFPSADWGVDS